MEGKEERNEQKWEGGVSYRRSKVPSGSGKDSAGWLHVEQGTRGLHGSRTRWQRFKRQEGI